MIEFDDFKKIISVLTEDEYRLVTDLSLTQGIEKSYSKRLIMFVRNNPNVTCQIAQIELYGRLKSVAFKQFVYRLKEKLLDSLLSADSIEKYPTYDDRAKKILYLRKRLIQFDILLLRNVKEPAERLINIIVRQAIVYEYYDLLVFALYKKMRIIATNTNIEQYANLYKTIEHYEDCRLVFHKSEQYIRRLRGELNSKIDVLKYHGNLTKFIFELEQDFLRTKSKTVLLNLLKLKSEFYFINENFEKVKEVLKQSVNLLLGNKTLSSDYEYGLSLLYIGIVEIHMYNFEQASVSLKKSFPLLKILEVNCCRIYQHQFLLGFYSIDIKSSETYLDLLNSFLYSGLIVHYFAATVRYYNACIKFLQEDYTSSYLLLNDVKELERDKESWNIAIRVLSIINQIELEKFEIADNLIENLRKHHERVRKTLPVTKRDEKIIQILIALSHHSYRFRRTYRVKAEAFSLLESLEMEYRWKILSPEMIVFHEWFKAKKDDKKYNHFEVMPAMKNKYSKLHKAFVPLAEDA